MTMASNNNIIAAVLQLRDEHRVTDCWHSVDTIASILNVTTKALNSALSKSPEFTHIDVQGSTNTCGIICFRCQLLHLHKGKPKKLVKHFLFFTYRKQPIFHQESYVWSDIYQKSAQLKLAPRSSSKTLRTVTPPTPNHEDGPAEFLLPPSPPRKKTRQSSNAVPPKRFDIFNDTKTKILFNITNRASFYDHIHRMREAL
jgi:hypothetical protein